MTNEGPLSAGKALNAPERDYVPPKSAPRRPGSDGVPAAPKTMGERILRLFADVSFGRKTCAEVADALNAHGNKVSVYLLALFENGQLDRERNADNVFQYFLPGTKPQPPETLPASAPPSKPARPPLETPRVVASPKPVAPAKEATPASTLDAVSSALAALERKLQPRPELEHTARRIDMLERLAVLMEPSIAVELRAVAEYLKAHP